MFYLLGGRPGFLLLGAQDKVVSTQYQHHAQDGMKGPLIPFEEGRDGQRHDREGDRNIAGALRPNPADQLKVAGKGDNGAENGKVNQPKKFTTK